MNQILKQLLEPYSPKTHNDYENALKEIMHHLALLGLWRRKFFEHAAFYGGTALRIFYHLNRFSEDLDFSLLSPKTNFDLNSYTQGIEDELKSFGLKVLVTKKEKTKNSAIESAFIKANTIENFLTIEVNQQITRLIPKNHQLKVRFEIDTNPPGLAQTEVKTLLTPIPFQVKLFTLPVLFAGKVHALLCHPWKNRVKGRDYYDFVWFVGQKTPLDLKHLELRMKQTGHLQTKEKLTLLMLAQKLKKKFEEINFDKAKQEILPFVRDPHSLALWSHDFFIKLIPNLTNGMWNNIP